jgi:hypothetical protein
VGKAFIADLYNQSKAFALFSDQEGESRVVAEALLCGCWVLAKRDVRGGAGDYLTDANSYRFTTVEEATNALIEIHRSPAQPARGAAIDELSEQTSAPRLRAELEKLLGPDRDDDDTWNLDNLARQLPSHVPTLRPQMRMEFTNDLNGPAAVMTFVEWLLDGSSADLATLEAGSEPSERPSTARRMTRWLETRRRTEGNR